MKIVNVKRNTYVENADSDNVPFRLSLCRFDQLALLTRNNAYAGECSSNELFNAVVPEHTTEVVYCQGLFHFKLLLESMEDHEALRPGLPGPDAEGGNDGDTFHGTFEEFACDLLVHQSESYSYPINEPTLVCFEVDSSYGSPIAVWDMLCEVDPNLEDVGFLFAPCGVLDDEGGMGATKYCFYIVACGDIPRYTKIFTVRANTFYPFHFECDENGFDHACQFVDPYSIAADHFIHWKSRFPALGLSSQDSGLTLISGRVLDTREIDEISTLDMYELEILTSDALEEDGSRKGVITISDTAEGDSSSEEQRSSIPAPELEKHF